MRFRGDPASMRGSIAPVVTPSTDDGQLDPRELHYALHPPVDVIFTETNPAPAKWVLHQASLLGSACVRPPLATVSEAGNAASPTCCAPEPWC